MYNKKIITKGLVFATAIVNIPIDSLANTIKGVEVMDMNIEDGVDENTIGDSIKKFFAKVVEPIEEFISEPREVIKVNKNIVRGSVCELTLNKDDFVPDLRGNTNGYEIIRVTTNGDKKLVKEDYDNLRQSGIPKIDLSNAYSDFIPGDAFSNATHLTEFKFPKGVTYIEDGKSATSSAFYNCTGLTGDLVIPDSIVKIGSFSFKDCSGFNGKLILPESLTIINSQAFRGCSGLIGELVFPESIGAIGTLAFNGCSGFTGDIVLPSLIGGVSTGVFKDCTGFDGRLVIPDTLEGIASQAFYNCTGLKGELIIPDSITTIGSRAFQNCTGFTGNVVIPNTVSSISVYALDGCSGVDKIVIGINELDSDTNYKEGIIANLPDTSQTVIDMPYGLDISGTWMETTNKTIGKPVIKNVSNGIESELVGSKGEAVSLDIPPVYQESNVSVLKDGATFILPAKNSDSKHIFTEVGAYKVVITTDLGNISVVEFEVEGNIFKEAEDAVEKAEQSEECTDIEDARDLVNKLPECSVKDQLQDRLNNIFPDVTLERQTRTSSFDVYVKSENMLSLSLDTNSLSFENYSGVDDMEMKDAVNITINSSLPYNLNAYMPSDIVSSNSNKMDRDVLNIKDSSEENYQNFDTNIDKLVLKESCAEGNSKQHSIDLKLASNNAHVADIYKTVIKFEAEQR